MRIRLSAADWMKCMTGLLDGVERELPSTAPMKTRAALEAFRSRLKEKRITRSRKAFEIEVEAFLQSRYILRAAAQRYVNRILPPAIRRATAVLKKAARLVAKWQTQRQALSVAGNAGQGHQKRLRAART